MNWPEPEPQPMTPSEVVDALGRAAAQMLRVQMEFERDRNPQLAGMITHLQEARKHLERVLQACRALESLP